MTKHQLLTKLAKISPENQRRALDYLRQIQADPRNMEKHRERAL